jgi:hypothetical protein
MFEAGFHILDDRFGDFLTHVRYSINLNHHADFL